MRRSGVALPLLPLCAALAVACAPAPGDALRSAREAADAHERERAIGLYQQHLERHPDDFDARLEYTLLLGEEWAFGGGERRTILDNLERLYTARPDNQRVRELYAMMLVREGQAAAAANRRQEAETLFLRALDVNPEVGTANYHLGVLYDAWERPQEAFEAYVAAALKRPRIPDLYLRLGRKYLERGQVDRAINTLELVAELRGVSTRLMPQMHCALAQAYARRGEPDVAAEHLQQSPADCAVRVPARERS